MLLSLVLAFSTGFYITGFPSLTTLHNYDRWALSLYVQFAFSILYLISTFRVGLGCCPSRTGFLVVWSHGRSSLFSNLLAAPYPAVVSTSCFPLLAPRVQLLLLIPNSIPRLCQRPLSNCQGVSSGQLLSGDSCLQEYLRFLAGLVTKRLRDVYY